MVHMKKFPLDGDNEGKEASLFVVPVSVKGKQKTKNLSYETNTSDIGQVANIL